MYPVTCPKRKESFYSMNYIDREHAQNNELEREQAYMHEVCGVSRGAGDWDDYGDPLDLTGPIIIVGSDKMDSIEF